MKHLHEIHDKQDTLDTRAQFITDLYKLMHKHGIKETEEDRMQAEKLTAMRYAKKLAALKHANVFCFVGSGQFKTSILLSEASITSNMERFTKEMEGKIPELLNAVKQVADNL